MDFEIVGDESRKPGKGFFSKHSPLDSKELKALRILSSFSSTDEEWRLWCLKEDLSLRDFLEDLWAGFPKSQSPKDTAASQPGFLEAPAKREG